MRDKELIQYIEKYDIIYLIVVNLDNNLICEYGDKNKLLYQGLIKTNFFDISTIHELNKSLVGQDLPKILKQGKVVCVIGKPDEKNMIGILYHEHRTPAELIKWTKYIYNCLLEIFQTLK